MSSPAPVIIDVGAHVGGSILFYKKLFPNCIVHAFEPSPDTYRQLEEKTGQISDVHLNNCGIAESAGELTLYQNTSSATNSFQQINQESKWRKELAIQSTEKVSVPVTTLDNYCSNHSLNSIDYLKLDVQGYERQCLEGARNLLDNQSISLIKLEIIFDDFYAKPASFIDIENLLSDYKYRLFSIVDLSYARTGQLRQMDVIYADNRVLP